MTDPTWNRRIVLASRPQGVPGVEHFRRDDQPVAELRAGEFLIRNRFLSVDPAQRGWVNASANYSDPVPVGGVMRALAVGEVVDSCNERFARGEYCYGWFGWQDYCVASDAQVLARVNPDHGPLSTALGIFGITGITAWLALSDIGRPQPGETVFVTTAAGAAGSIVGQLAQQRGCRVVGLTGSAAKTQLCVEEFGYHAALNYRDGFDEARLRALCPQGVDVFFDNTAGTMADAVWSLLNLRARVIQCGTASIASWDPPPQGPRRERTVLTKRLTHQGFIIFDHVARFPEVIANLAGAVRRGELRYREDIVDGLDAAPLALARLYQGENQGKVAVRL